MLEFFLEASGEENKLLEQKFRKYVEMALTSQSVEKKEADKFLELMQEER